MDNYLKYDLYRLVISVIVSEYYYIYIRVAMPATLRISFNYFG